MTYREWFENLRHNLRAAGDENKALDCDSVLEEEDGHWGSAENAMVEQARDEALERLTLASWPDDSEASWVLPQFLGQRGQTGRPCARRSAGFAREQPGPTTGERDMTTHTGPWYCFRCRSRLREPAGTGPAGTPIWRCRACGCYEWRRDRVVVPTPAEVFERLEACRTDGQRTELAQGAGHHRVPRPHGGRHEAAVQQVLHGPGGRGGRLRTPDTPERCGRRQAVRPHAGIRTGRHGRADPAQHAPQQAARGLARPKTTGGPMSQTEDRIELSHRPLQAITRGSDAQRIGEVNTFVKVDGRAAVQDHRVVRQLLRRRARRSHEGLCPDDARPAQDVQDVRRGQAGDRRGPARPPAAPLTGPCGKSTGGNPPQG